MERRTLLKVAAAMVADLSLSGRLMADEPKTPKPETADARAEVNAIYPDFDLRFIPFSYCGSFHVLTHRSEDPKGRVQVQTLRRKAIPYRYQTGAWPHELMGIALVRGGRDLECNLAARPWQIKMEGEGASATIAFFDKDTLLIEAHNCELHLISPRALTWRHPATSQLFYGCDADSTHYSTLHVAPGGAIRMADPKGDHGETLMISGGAHLLAGLRLSPVEDHTPPPLPAMEQVLSECRSEVERWMAKMPEVPKRYHAAAQTGWFLLWVCQVAAEGEYTRQAILSGKRIMANVWSWDNCLNALAVCKADARLAWDQLFVVLDHQAPSGVLPDVVNDLGPLFLFNKPPVWGWTIHRLLANTPESERKAYVAEAYPRVARFQEWWFKYRDWNGDGVPKYMHGNDSGWDNSTIFDEHYPVEAPDLTAHLALQAEELAEMATLLGKLDEAAKWKQESLRLIELFHSTFVRDSEVVYKVLRPEGLVTRSSTSLLTRMPILLAERLRPEVRKRLVADLANENTFLSKFGPATEAMNSPKYTPNGYWRGPVWAISTYLIFEGLRHCGETALARTLATRFCDLCSRKAIFSENYNALTGADQYDSGMPWTSSDFLLMAAWLKQEGEV